MHGYVPRLLTQKIRQKLQRLPAVIILGPRQCGKSTLTRHIISGIHNALYLDLERPSDIRMLQDPEAFFGLHGEQLICLDEIQRMPEIFPLLRSILDERNRNGQLLLLGSASPALIRQSSESLAGRTAYLELTPFLHPEVVQSGPRFALRDFWLKGGFPRSILEPDLQGSHEWRLDFIRTFQERDIPQLGFRIPARTFDRFWKMCAHLHGQLLNSSKLGESLGVSHHTIRSYLELLEQTFFIRLLLPYAVNLKKRLIKSPKVYLRDSGVLHALLGIVTHNDLLGHPVYGASWEGFVLEQVLSLVPEAQASFYRTVSGSEVDLILEKDGRRMAVECKASTAPELSRGFWTALNDLEIEEAWIIAPVRLAYPVKRKVQVAPLKTFLSYLRESWAK
jgi:predicted AAA+ superfamily ATPase